MYYKVLKNGKVIDVLDHLTFVKYQQKHNIMIVCLEREAQGIVSSDGAYIWHVEGFYRIPAEGYDTVTLEEIDRYEYDQLKIFNCRSIEDLIDEYTLLLLNGGVL